ncbi:hypothetical protein [Amphritea balenae]|uniref:Regulatory signaling modulator protein AmpE n=1 Tax=Amphritea balenae TaxID=452629 RepID=A0A3P1SSF0_9GAMM|nr:hypothetical protein [Amphritea balenae]RRD00112.1 hypothetical protein EHS89_07845 [Amphritea balenae]GGK76741.1 hypothetical protein GCM10007941_28580 [Amphritea balenae]
MKFLALMLLMLSGRYKRRPAWAEKLAVGGQPEKPVQWIMLGLYVVILETLLLMFYSWEFGAVVLAIELLLLYIFLPNWAPCDLTGEYFNDWCRGDYQAAWLDLSDRLQLNGDEVGELNRKTAHYAICQQYIYLSFISFFALLFWFILLGLPGIFLALWACWKRQQFNLQQVGCDRLNSDTDNRESVKSSKGFFDKLSDVLLWLPARGLALTFFIVGNGLSTYEQLKIKATEKIGSSDWLFRIALAAIGDDSYKQYSSDTELSEDQFQHHGADEIRKFSVLIRRSAILWLVVFGVLTMLGAETPLY